MEKLKAINKKRKEQGKPLVEMQHEVVKKKPQKEQFKFDEFLYRMTKDEVFIKAGETATLKLNFLPMTLGKHECCVVLCDDMVGEKEYRITGKANLPKPNYLPPVKTSLEH